MNLYSNMLLKDLVIVEQLTHTFLVLLINFISLDMIFLNNCIKFKPRFRYPIAELGFICRAILLLFIASLNLLYQFKTKLLLKYALKQVGLILAAMSYINIASSIYPSYSKALPFIIIRFFIPLFKQASDKFGCNCNTILYISMAFKGCPKFLRAFP